MQWTDDQLRERENQERTAYPRAFDFHCTLYVKHRKTMGRGDMFATIPLTGIVPRNFTESELNANIEATREVLKAAPKARKQRDFLTMLLQERSRRDARIKECVPRDWYSEQERVKGLNENQLQDLVESLVSGPELIEAALNRWEELTT